MANTKQEYKSIDEFLHQTGLSSLKLYKDIYKVHRNYLNNATCQTFAYDGIIFPSREIERLLQGTGFTGITKTEGQVIPTYGSMSGVTVFPDMYTTYTFATPVSSGMRKIDTDCVIAQNNYNRTPTQPDNDLTAHLLTHIDLTIQTSLINNRANAVIGASTQQQADTVNAWFKSLANGKSLAITQKNDLYTPLNESVLIFNDLFNRNNTDITEYYRLKDNILKAFFTRWGLTGNQEKAERVINAELDTGLNRALFNLNDMLACRKEMCEKVNAMFGTNWSVRLNSDIERQKLDSKLDSNKVEREVLDNGNNQDDRPVTE